MEKLVIRKSIEIKAPKEVVWDVMLLDKFTRQWYSAFSEGSYAESDWTLGSKARFLDQSGQGMVGKIVANDPSRIISIEYEGVINNNVDDYDSEAAKAVKGGMETYRLIEKDGITTLFIESDMTEELYEMLSVLWDQALLKVKELAEEFKN
ncbi:SRPBCC family protein [Solitalea lacus]|uniref:SRPBCC family protein n=1 Tax=Solitalea lacus TaxID=2911172 RepID=UPI001EDBB21C|nr:SRPBCC domain-containing protein [Solitalea lacus]UKJ07664.1 SRPBCC domain-containing protein [Solitalea lacus]